MRNVLVFLVALALVAGCGQSAPPKGKDGGPGAGAPATGGPVQAGVCTEYAQKLCEVVGAGSPTCQGLTANLALLPPVACKAGLTDVEYTRKQFGEKGKQCTELMTRLCADIGPDTKTCQMVKMQTPRFPPERCATMLGQYDKVLGDLKTMEAGNKPLDAAQQAVIAADTTSSFGPKTAKVTLVEFSDFECPYCSKAADVLRQLKNKYGDKVRFVFRHFPLPMHKNAPLASQAVMAAAAQGKFMEAHDLLFANAKALDRASLDKYAETLKLDLVKFKKALDSGEFAKAVDADVEMGKKIGVRGTPTIIVNGERVDNPLDVAVVSGFIDKALAK